jgi:ribosomal protein S18 acetylase RimI-like enzyme
VDDAHSLALPEDAEALTALVNEAYLPAESFLYDGDRTDVDEIRSRLAAGTFLLRRGSDGRLEGCVFVESEGERGYLGMLAVAPRCQGRGLAHSLVAAGENFLRARGVRLLEIEVVSLLPALVRFYERQGYRLNGRQRPFHERQLHHPCHFVYLEKALA